MRSVEAQREQWAHLRREAIEQDWQAMLADPRYPLAVLQGPGWIAHVDHQANWAISRGDSSILLQGQGNSLDHAREIVEGHLGRAKAPGFKTAAVGGLTDLWNHFRQWEFAQPDPHEAVQHWGNVETYLQDQHNLDSYADDYWTHPTVVNMAKLHSMAQGKDFADGQGEIPDNDLVEGAALGLLKIRKNQQGQHESTQEGSYYQ